MSDSFKETARTIYMNRSAFPDRRPESGLTVLEYFIAHAPAQIPDWYEAPPFLEEQPEKPLGASEWGGNDISDVDRHLLHHWMSDPSYDLRHPLQGFQQQIELYNKERSAYEKRLAAWRFFNWRLFYAKGQLALLIP
jgi:hypothetical protein